MTALVDQQNLQDVVACPLYLVSVTSIICCTVTYVIPYNDGCISIYLRGSLPWGFVNYPHVKLLWQQGPIVKPHVVLVYGVKAVGEQISLD